MIVDTAGRAGAINMAIDYSLLRRAQRGDACLRLYRWSPACVSFGRNEAALRRYDRDKIQRLGLDTVRRPTGGRAVWHEHELTYAVAAPLKTFGSLQQTYQTIHHMLATALTDIGVLVAHADSARNAEALHAGPCFSSPVGGEILVGGRKLVGSAQLREGEAFLQHGSILLDGGQDMVTLIAQNATNPTHTATLTAALGRSVGFDETSDVIANRAQSDWPGHWHAAISSPQPSTCFSFDDSAWTWRR